MAVNEKISAVLKDLPLRILTSSYNERKEIIHGIISIIDLPDITESIIKGVSKLLPSTLHSYRDQKSQGLVKSLIQSLLKHHPLWTSQHLSQAILNFASTYKLTNATNSVAKCLYAPLSWSFIILKSLDVSNEVNKGSFENLVKAQSILVAHVVASTNPKVLDSMFKSLCSMFQNSGKPSVLTEKYGEAILKSEQTSHTVILGSYFIKYLKAAKLEGDIAKYKTFLLDSFIKVTISTKVQPPIYLIQQSQHLLATVTQEAFKTLFLPAIQRSMLRNPEILLPVIRYIIEQFVVDLSPYCLDLGKLLGANLYSKDDALRSAAVLTLRGLASRCSVGAEVEKLTKHLIGIFNGSEGIGNLSENKVTKDSDLLIKSTTEQLLKILDTEVHEKTLVVALQVLTAWVTHLSPSPLPLKDTPTPSLPAPLLASFKKALGAKALAPPVRTGYLNCLVSLGGDGGAREFLGDLIKSVERAQAQPTQAPIVHEAISASILLLRLSRVVRDDPKLNAVLESTILNTKKQVLLSEKILAQASPEVAYHAALLSTDILLNKSSQLQGSHSHLYRPILTCLTSPLWDLRRKGRALVKTLYGVEDRMTYALNLLGEFNTLLDTIPVKEFDSKTASSAAAVDASANKENKDSTSTSLEPGTPDHIASSQLYSSLVFLVSHPAFQYDDKERLALATLQCDNKERFALATLQPGCHEKIIAHVRARNAHALMLNVLRKLNIEDAKKFVLTHESTLVDTYIGSSTQANAPGAASSAHNNVLRFLTRTNPAVIWTPIFEKLVDFFETTQLAISNDEYFTFLTPEGQIYDKTLLESLDANSDSHLTNLKRESKAYSYREQLEEIQLRKELEAKKAREGKQKQTQYTPKQKEAIKAQLDKESDIRKRVSKMNAELSRVLNLLRLARTTLRLASPKCDIDQAWTEEPLSRAIDRCLAYMSSLPSPLSGPGFCYCFQLIRLVLSRSGSETASDSSVATCLSVMITHSGLRHEDILNIRHPATLPRKHMFTLLLDLIGSGKLKPHLLNQLETTVLAVASSGSGATSCARASFDEISVLLAGLKHPLPLVREVSLKACRLLVPVFPSVSSAYDECLLITRRLWVVKFDSHEENRPLADLVWTEAELSSGIVGLEDGILEDIIYPVTVVQESAARALAELLKTADTKAVQSTIDSLLAIYQDKLAVIPPKIDSLGRVAENPIDIWEPRSGVALALAQLTSRVF
ncbi:hypothetical protein M8J75_015865 [Diaphorina citri]|nr:hypothetical protein M8J75_015865 [Diaphorina citri]